MIFKVKSYLTKHKYRLIFKLIASKTNDTYVYYLAHSTAIRQCLPMAMKKRQEVGKEE